MADSADTRTNDPRRLLASVVEPPPVRKPLKINPQALRLTIWLGLLASGAAAFIAIVSFAWDEARTLAQANAADVTMPLDANWAGSTSPDYLEIVSEVSLQQPVVDEDSAYLAARRATELDPSRAFAWSTLAYLETRRNQGAINQASLDALTRSMDACPLCDQDLIRWRFNFVLTNWAAIPETLKARAFEHADLLRWIGPHAEFLAEMRFKARLQGIPFDAYRAAVDTPVRSWDIAPTTLLRGGRAPAG